jgi:hypothetical protein
MQRPTYASVPPAQSPPLHHPVPQHVSTVPQLRSPPPPSSQGSYGYGQSQDPQAAAAAGGAGYNNMHPAFGGFMEDPTTKMAMGFAGQGISVGQQYMEQNVWFGMAYDETNASKLIIHTDQQVRQRLRPEALLQRVQRIRLEEAPAGPLSMATQALVSPDLTQ